MTKRLLRLMRKKLAKTILRQHILDLEGDTILVRAYSDMIKSYEDTIMFLEAELGKKK